MTRHAYIGLFRSFASGKWCVTFPDLPGCWAEGDDLEEARANARQALRNHLEDLDDAPPRPRSPAELLMDAHGDWGLARQFVDAVMHAVQPAESEDLAPVELLAGGDVHGGHRGPGLGI